jgi:hypothetical protein
MTRCSRPVVVARAAACTDHRIIVIQFRYSEIERGLVESLPELRPAAEFYWKTEGEQGQDSGPYIFFEDLFGAYVEVLLWLPSSPRRDQLLRRAFAAVEGMLGSSDSQVSELAAIGLLEDREPEWLKRAKPFVGPLAAAWLKRHHHLWAICSSANDRITPQILDGYHVRTVIARELAVDGVSVEAVPGTTYAEGQLP